MVQNPFTSTLFANIWSRHFNASRKGILFKFLKGVGFVKSSFLPLYYNVGKNITNGMSYNINSDEVDFRNKVFLIHDVPSYFSIKSECSSSLKCLKTPQYSGFLTELESFDSYDDFSKNQFKSNTRYKFRRNQERLEACFDVKYSIYHGHIETVDYEKIMNSFKALLTKRFNELQQENDILETWDYYYDLIYNMLIEKRALLIVIWNKTEPIGVSFSFLSKTTMFYAITSFDTDYYRFNLGHTTIIKLFQWCYENGYTVYDFSKGDYEYKNRWTNKEYIFENHILYDSKSKIASSIAKTLKAKYVLKQYLRDKKFNLLLVKYKFKLKNWNANTGIKAPFKIMPLKNHEVYNSLPLVNLDDEKHQFPFLNRVIFDELYKNPENIQRLNIYKSSTKKPTYYIVGEKSGYLIKII